MSRPSLTVAEALWRALEAEEVEYVFGIPGGNILPIYDAYARLAPGVIHVLVRHEQVGAHAAEGYTHATGRVGVCMGTSGPGATNLVTGIADAFHDRVPLVAITGNVPVALTGTGAFQEADIVAITAPVTKRSVVLRDPRALSDTIAEAFQLARSGRPGPVLVDIPKDVQLARIEFEYAPRGAARPPIDAAEITSAAALVATATRPLFYLGGGVRSAGVHREVRALVEAIGAAAVTTVHGKGAIPEDHPLCLGMLGMHGGSHANLAVQRADLLVVLGARFDDRATGRLSGFAPSAKVVHADLDPAEISKLVPATVALRGDLRDVVPALHAEVVRGFAAGARVSLDPWRSEVAALVAERAPRYAQSAHGPLLPQYVVERLHRRVPQGTVVTTGVGQHQMFAAQYWKTGAPREFITSGGFGTMGFCLPSAIGAQLGRPDALVVGIDGDGSFQMTVQDLATAADLGLPLKIFVLNNRALGMVRQLQHLFQGRRYLATALSGRPDLVRLAEAYGCLGLRAETAEELDAAIERALAHGGGPVVVDVRVSETENVFPIVPPGSALSEMIEGEPPPARVTAVM